MNRPGGLWWYSDLLLLGGNLSLALLIEIVPRWADLNAITVCLHTFLSSKVGVQMLPYLALTQDVVFVSSLLD